VSAEAIVSLQTKTKQQCLADGKGGHKNTQKQTWEAKSDVGSRWMTET
jgi:hypothetical protein